MTNLLNRERMEQNMDRCVEDITTEAYKDQVVQTYDNLVGFFRTPKFKYAGIVVKQALPNPNSQRLLIEEAKSIKKIQKILKKQELYRVPELLSYDPEHHTIVMQRLFGPTALDLVLKDPYSAGEVAREISQWTSYLHQHDREEREYSWNETEIFRRFMSVLAEDRTRFPEDQRLSEIERNIKGISPKNYKLTSATIHGDLSPLHFYFEEHAIYGIDFNGSREGLILEDVASFISNSRFHLICAFGDQHEVTTSFIEEFMKEYMQQNEPLPTAALNFTVALFDYLKSRDEPPEIKDKYLKQVESLISSSENDIGQIPQKNE